MKEDFQRQMHHFTFFFYIFSLSLFFFSKENSIRKFSQKIQIVYTLYKCYLRIAAWSTSRSYFLFKSLLIGPSSVSIERNRLYFSRINSKIRKIRVKVSTWRKKSLAKIHSFISRQNKKKERKKISIVFHCMRKTIL